MDWIFLILDHTKERVRKNQNRNHMISVRATINKSMKRNSLTHKIDFNGRNLTHTDGIFRMFAAQWIEEHIAR